MKKLIEWILFRAPKSLRESMNAFANSPPNDTESRFISTHKGPDFSRGILLSFSSLARLAAMDQTWTHI
jgi:hypothetical protein